MVAKNYIFGRKYNLFLKDLVAYYPLNSNANDLSGKGHNGTLVSSPTFTTGKVSNAINFGSDAPLRYVNISDNDDFSFTNGTNDVPFSVSLWVNLSATSVTGNWFVNKRGATTGTDEWQFIYIGGKFSFLKFQHNNNSIYQEISTNTGLMTLNTWYHLCYTDNGSGSVGSGKIYVNGINNTNTNQNVGGTYTRMNNGTFITRIGTGAWDNVSTALKHRGLIDELAIWKNRELTATEVLELYNKGNSGNPII